MLTQASIFSRDKNELVSKDCTKRKALFKDILVKYFKARWKRCWVGSNPSPFYTIIFYYLAEEYFSGESHEIYKIICNGII